MWFTEWQSHLNFYKFLQGQIGVLKASGYMGFEQLKSVDITLEKTHISTILRQVCDLRLVLVNIIVVLNYIILTDTPNLLTGKF